MKFQIGDEMGGITVETTGPFVDNGYSLTLTNEAAGCRHTFVKLFDKPTIMNSSWTKIKKGQETQAEHTALCANRDLWSTAGKYGISSIG